MDDAGSVEEQIRRTLVAMLREGYPYMKTDTTNNIALKCQKLLEAEVLAQMPEMIDTKARISFNSLSAEIRNRIYELLLIQSKEGEGGHKETNAIYIGKDDGESLHKLTPWALQPAITKCSRQIRQETLPIYYGANQFLTYTEVYFGQPDSLSVNPDVGHSAAMKWLRAIGPENASLLRDIRVRFPSFSTDVGPATRFIEHASRIGIDLRKGAVTGFVNEWIGRDYFSNGYDERPRRVWRVVDETDVVYHGIQDILYGRGRPTYVEGEWESESGWTDCTQ